MKYKSRVAALVNLYDNFNHDYLLLVASATFALSKLPHPKNLNETNLKVINGIQRIYSGNTHTKLEQNLFKSIKGNKNIFDSYLQWEQTEVIEKSGPIFPIVFLRLNYLPWYKFYISFNFHKKDKRIQLSEKMYKDLEKVDLKKVRNYLLNNI